MENKNSLQLLVSTMNQTDYSLIQKMNIKSSAIVINQTTHTSFDIIEYENFQVYWYNFNNLGLSLSRNLSTLLSTSDLVLFVDDDEILLDNYYDLVTNAFNVCPKAHLISFNLISKQNMNRFINTQIKKLSIFNSFRYGAARIAFRKNAIYKKHISFNMLFGPGSKYSGEDSVFISDCLKRGLSFYSHPGYISIIDDNPTNSSWFKGYNKKYFIDKGAIFANVSNFFFPFFIFYFLIKNSKTYYSKVKLSSAFIWMITGSFNYLKHQKNLSL
jgi:hypothetical protein